MDSKKWLSRFFGIPCALLLLVSCGTPQPTPTPPPTATTAPTATPEPTATPAPPTETPTPEVLELDYLGIAEGIWYPYSTEFYYAAGIETDLGVKVNFSSKTEFLKENWYVTKDANSYILESLRTDTKLQKAIGEAEIVTIMVSNGVIENISEGDYRQERCGGDDNMDCFREALLPFKANCDAIFEEVLSWCKSGTIVRTMTYAYGKTAMDWDVDLAPFYLLVNEQIVQSAAEHNIPVARVDIAFNGTAGDEDAVAKGLMDGWTPSLAGMQAIADLLRDLGYEPTIP